MSRNKHANDQTTALIKSIDNNDQAAVIKLIKDGVDINKSKTSWNADSFSGFLVGDIEVCIIFPLIKSVQDNSRKELTKLLLNHDANPNVKDNAGCTALQIYLLNHQQNNLDLEVFALFVAKGAIIKNKDIILLKKSYSKKLFTVTQLVVAMKKIGLLNIQEENKQSIAKTFYDTLKFLHKDYPSFEFFAQANEIPSLLYLTTKAATPVIAEYLKIEKDSKKNVLQPNLANSDPSQIDKVEPLVKLINKSLPREYQLTHPAEIQQMIDNIEYQPLGADIDSN